MAGTRTAPTVNATPTEVQVTLHLIDASGDQFTQMLPIDAARTDAEIEAYAAAYQAATNSSLWKITGTSLFVGDKDASNAVADYRASIASGNNLLFKDVSAGKTLSIRQIAPLAATMQGNQDIPLVSSTELTALILASLVMLPTYVMQQAQFTGRTERSNNPVINT